MAVHPVKRSRILLFGSQALSFDAIQFRKLCAGLLSSPEHLWLLETLLELSDSWTSATQSLPFLKTLPSEKLLGQLSGWLKGGEAPASAFPLPNVLLTPLVVAEHLLQYIDFSRDTQHSSLQSSEVIGLCTGLLSSQVVSASRTPDAFEKNGGVAIRLAMLVGAVVDLGEIDPFGSLSVAWLQPEGSDKLYKILEDFQEAYVSVVFDEKRVTVTTNAATIPLLRERLQAAGLVAAEIALRGKFHSRSHSKLTDEIIEFCNSNAEFRYTDSEVSTAPHNATTNGVIQSSALAHKDILNAILVERSEWYRTFSTLLSYQQPSPASTITCFGSERCVPPSLQKSLGSLNIVLRQAEDRLNLSSSHILGRTLTKPTSVDASDQQIAIIGMSVMAPGANDVVEFSQLLRAGQSQHQEVPSDRFGFETAWRDVDPKRTWYGNFIENHDTFDHKFFKKSPREMASTDPQHRLVLQAAYQAVEQSGYFNISGRDKHIGCYIGVGLVDYENNVACYSANAYTATGNLRSFAAGKISHYFGWTGPGLTIDTACSSSAVSIHQACRAITTGECSAALAGGVNLMTSPEWFQNLAGASFLSPTGQCKPFDAKADGYCRGEAVGAIFLKKLSTAIQDGDQILGVIPSTGVYQNENCTPITVPNAVSLSDLFRNVVEKAKLTPNQISVVEAHGTGTQVGDPAEYDSVRRVFGGDIRQKPLSLGSVKGLIGHSESASGMIAMIKILIMINEGFVPPQPSFQTINPNIHASQADNISVNTALKPWDANFRAALINNYGASGSNASLIVTQAPKPHGSGSTQSTSASTSDFRYPFWFTAFDAQSMKNYASRFLQFLNHQNTLDTTISIEDLSFQLSRQSNRSLQQASQFCCSSIEELKEKLQAVEAGENSIAVAHSTRPAILCLGGQVSTYIGLDYHLYESVSLLRLHLDNCDEICRSMGLPSIYPTIFQREPVEDLVQLQTMLFATQYACAQSWLDSGVQVAAVIGHSFGELTALCVSNVLSVRDTLKLVAGRARLIQERWGPEKGSMMAIEGDQATVESLLVEANTVHNSGHPVAIACYNGPRSFTLSGPTEAIEVVTAMATQLASYSQLKFKRLNVTNAFHSSLVESFQDELEQIGRTLTFQKPNIRIERATEFQTSDDFTSSYVADHMRNPVYFNHAVQRLSKLYDSAIWLEAGSNSTVATMAGRALGLPSSSHFQSINITSSNANQALADATLSLWKAGLKMMFWSHHSLQTSQYALFFLPPYQFEKSKHWMELKKPAKEATQVVVLEETPTALWTFMGYQDAQNQVARFRINATTKMFKDFLLGHVIVRTASLCPSILQLQIIVDALTSIVPQSMISEVQPQLDVLQSHAPMGYDTSKHYWLDAKCNTTDSLAWDFKIISHAAQNPASTTLHVSGRLVFKSDNDATVQAEFSKYERFVSMRRCMSLLDGNDVEEVSQGRNVYQAFSEIVKYSETFKCTQKIVGKGLESAGRVVKKGSAETWIDTGLFDSMCQIAGIYVNCMTDVPEGDMYISDRIDQWMRSPKIRYDKQWPDNFNVFCCHQRPSDKQYISDVFVFDPRDGSLLEVIIGIHYQRIPKDTMRKIALKVTPGANAIVPVAAKPAPVSISSVPATISTSSAPLPAPVVVKKQSSVPDIAPKVRELVSTLSGLEPEEIKDDSLLGDIGIDSLMAMELAREIETAFKCTLDQDELVDLTDFRSLINCINKTLGYDGQATQDQEVKLHETPESEAAKSFNGVALPNGHLQLDGAVPLVNVIVDNHNASNSSTHMSGAIIVDAFNTTKEATDRFITENKLNGYMDHIMPKLNELCAVHILDAFDKLGCSIRSAKPGQQIPRIKYLKRHEQFMEFIYDFLEKTARLVDIDGSRVFRTSVTCSSRSAEAVVQDLMRAEPVHAYDYKLTYLTGVKLAECLTGEVDALQLIFGTPEGREIAAGMYSKSPINSAWIKQMEYFLGEVVSSMAGSGEPIKILEMGSGTGGTTSALVPLLASLNVPVEYTVTDLSSSLVANARKRFKSHSWIKFKTLDIEKAPSAELLHSQHIVLATNCVHATHKLSKSTKNIHDILRPDGMLMMLEMTEPLPWIDLIFGLVEGWWLFDDGRKHALVQPAVWERTLQQSGFGYVDWTDGAQPEAAVQRIIIALASDERYERSPLPLCQPSALSTDHVARQAVIDGYVAKYTENFSIPSPLQSSNGFKHSKGFGVLVTGATGSLGSFLVAHFVSLPEVDFVICVNRVSQKDPLSRQLEALESKQIELSSESLSKLYVFETDASKPSLGLSNSNYEFLTQKTTHIVHNAWPMSITRPIAGFEGQFKVMSNLITLLCNASAGRPKSFQGSFQFISSIATVGFHPLWSGQELVLEERMTAQSVLPTGYGDAKLVCEHMLDATLRRASDRFRAMVVRIGQIGGSTTSGYWNPVEHLAFLIKSSHTLKLLPDFKGTLSWCPVDLVAASLSDLLISPAAPHAVYQIENPTRQPWAQMLEILASALGVPRQNIVPFNDWLRAVRLFAGSAERDNPAARLADFLEAHFIRMSCGDLILATENSREHSQTMRSIGEVTEELVRKYIDAWKLTGFLRV